MRIAQFIQRYPPALGGSEAYFARLGRYLADQGDAVEVWTSTARDLSAFWAARAATVPAGTTVEDGITVRRFPLAYRIRGRRWLLKPLSLVPYPPLQAATLPCNPFMPAMTRAVESAGPVDVVHASAFPYLAPILAARRLARRCGATFAITPFLHLGDPHDPRDSVRRAYTAAPMRWLLREADVVLVQTPGERDAAVAMGVPAGRVVLHGLGVDPAEVIGGDRGRARRAWGVPHDVVVVGHLANLSPEKGTLDLLTAAGRLDPATVRLVLAGPAMPAYVAAKPRLAAGLPLTELGPLTDAGRRDFFAGIDVFCLPSRSDSFGLVLLEAWANGVPVVAYEAGGVADLVRSGVDGLLVRCGRTDALADALRALIGDVGMRRAFGDAGRERCRREFVWADKLAMVRAALAGRAGGSPPSRPATSI